MKFNIKMIQWCFMIRMAKESDAERLVEIYSYYVEETAVSFEYEVPSVEEFRTRITRTLENYPYLVLIEGGMIVAYAYAGSFHLRAAYRHSAELSVYVDAEYRRKGFGKALYLKLFEMLTEQNVYPVHACITSPDEPDENLTDDSERFHRHMGFNTVGKHSKCGYKFGKWYSIVWMDKEIADRPDSPEEFIPYSKLH